VISRAKEILANLERSASNAHSNIIKARKQSQLSLFDHGNTKLKEWISGLEIDGMTPLDALVELSKLKEYVNTNGK
jgi:DNA mismatch repair protein MutS